MARVNEERDKVICEQSLVKTNTELATEYNLSKQRIGRILFRGGIAKRKTGRESFTGIQLLPEVKAAVKEVAKQEKKSVSRFVSELIEGELKNRGITVEKFIDARMVPLPFGGGE